jgi:hypothetical protein
MANEPSELSPAIAAPQVTDAIPSRLRRIGTTPRGVVAMCVVGTLALALFASRDLPSWAERLHGYPGGPNIQHAAVDWDGAMARIGFVRPHETLRATVAWLLAEGWKGPLPQ